VTELSYMLDFFSPFDQGILGPGHLPFMPMDIYFDRTYHSASLMVVDTLAESSWPNCDARRRNWKRR